MHDPLANARLRTRPVEMSSTAKPMTLFFRPRIVSAANCASCGENLRRKRRDEVDGMSVWWKCSTGIIEAGEDVNARTMDNDVGRPE